MTVQAITLCPHCKCFSGHSAPVDNMKELELEEVVYSFAYICCNCGTKWTNIAVRPHQPPKHTKLQNNIVRGN
jgi:hypothetical protein